MVKLGALVYGGANSDSIQLNDITLWTGVPVNPNEGGRSLQVGFRKSEGAVREDYRPPIPSTLCCKAITRVLSATGHDQYIKDCNQGEFTVITANWARQLSGYCSFYRRNGIPIHQRVFCFSSRQDDCHQAECLQSDPSTATSHSLPSFPIR